MILRSRTRPLAVALALAIALGGCSSAPTSGHSSAPESVITSLEPAIGPLTPGTTVTITGEHLADVTAVTFAGRAAVDVTVLDDSRVTAVVPVAAEYRPAVDAVHVFAGSEALTTDGQLLFERTATSPVDAQLAYAFAHWSSDTYNREVYGDFNPVGGDCMNFVSQTLIARGIPQTDGWNFTSPSEQTASWIYVPAFEDYLVAHPESGFTRLTIDQRDQVEVGDLVVFDWESNNSPDHIQVVSDIRDVDGTRQILMVGHNLDSNWRDLDTVITVDHPGGLAWFWKVP